MDNTTQEINLLLINANKALNNKNYNLAKNCLEQILIKKPNLFEANFNLGVLNFQLGNLNSSINFLERSKQINPKIAQVYFYLGLIHNKKREVDLSIKNFKKVLEIDPNNSFAHYNLGTQYKEISKYEEAEKYLKYSIKINSNFENAYSNLFDLYDKSNQTLKYEKLLNKALKNLSNKSLLAFYKGVHEYKKKNYEKTIETFKKLNLEEKNFAQNVIRVGILAKSYDQINKFDKAYKYFSINNNLTEKYYGEKIDKNIFLQYVEQRKDFFENFNKENWTNYPPISKCEPIFLIGFPRSGTTLLDTILRTSNFIEVIEEKPTIKNFLIEIEKTTKNEFSRLNNLDNNFISRMQSFYLKERNKYYDNKNAKIIIDKMPLNIIHVAEILRFFPKAKFIFALRHPYDSVLSCFMQNFTLNPAMKNFLSIESASYLYNLVMNLWKIYEKNFSPNVHIIKYEDIVKDFELSTKNIFTFLDLQWSEKIKEFYNTALNRKDMSTPSYNQVTSPLYIKSIDRWKNYRGEFSNVKKYLDKWVKEFNYEL